MWLPLRPAIRNHNISFQKSRKKKKPENAIERCPQPPQQYSSLDVSLEPLIKNSLKCKSKYYHVIVLGPNYVHTTALCSALGAPGRSNHEDWVATEEPMCLLNKPRSRPGCSSDLTASHFLISLTETHGVLRNKCWPWKMCFCDAEKEEPQISHWNLQLPAAGCYCPLWLAAAVRVGRTIGLTHWGASPGAADAQCSARDLGRPLRQHPKVGCSFPQSTPQ